MIKLTIPFKLFEDCIPVKGANRSLIMDVTRSTYYFIPNDLYEILETYDGKPFDTLIDRYGKENEETLMEYMNFLIDHELIFLTNHPERFPKLNMARQEIPSDIYQAIIDIGENVHTLDQNFRHPHSSLVASLNKLNCKYLQFRFYNQFNLDLFKDWLNALKDSTLIGIDVFIRYESSFEDKSYFKSLNFHPKVNTVYIYHAPRKRRMEKSNFNDGYTVHFTKENITSCLSCGVVSPAYFITNLKAVTRSYHHNSCLHKKVSIDVEGNIKNCPSMKESFGNIKDTRLEQAIRENGFENYWNIKKDDVMVCKDCEFRHVCTDCRAYTEDPANIYSKPLKCGYSPYTNTWETWSKNPLKQKAIEHYHLNDLVKKKP